MPAVYKWLLIAKYLRRRIGPLAAAAAVMLCTAMVIIVISVMGGFLEMMRTSAQKLTGQVTVLSDVTGFEHYEALADQLALLPQVQQVTPIIRCFGLLNMSGEVHTVEVLGIEPTSLDGVIGYGDTLHWKRDDLRQYLYPQQLGSPTPEQEKLLETYDPHTLGMGLTVPAPWQSDQVKGAIVPGIEVNPWSQRDDEGQYDIAYARLGTAVTLTVLPLTGKGTLATLSPAVRQLAIVNEFKSGLYEIDANRVYISFALLQEMLEMQAQTVYEKFNPDTGEPIGAPTRQPGRASELMIKGVPGADLAELKAAVEQTVSDFQQTQSTIKLLRVMTWQERHRMLLNAVEKEKGMITVLFAIISGVAVVMIAVVFSMIVLEKTRDIGTLLALGARRGGIAGIFLGYGLAVGVVGALLGLALAAAIVLNLNEIQDLLFYLFGFKMWDPKIYYFDRIPNRLDWWEVSWIMLGAVLSSLLGAVVPAIQAARLRPVEALRYE